MRTPASHLAVIIPLGPGEAAPSNLITALPKACEIYLVAADTTITKTLTTSLPRNVTLLHCSENRAAAFNMGITVAAQLDNHTSFPLYFWLLHADSILPATAVKQLCHGLHPEHLHYAKLKFTDGPRWLWLNAKLANIRSRLVNMPWGDQGFCFSQQVWQQVGPFDEQAPYGEDNLFIKHACRQRITLRQLPFTLGTSGRKYTTHGWLKTTAKHIYLGFRQRWGRG